MRLVSRAGGRILVRRSGNLIRSSSSSPNQSFVAGYAKNGVQFMVKDSKKYAATGGWGYAHFNDGKPAETAVLTTCFPCHAAIKDRDYIFTRYAP
jgi:Cytochrome P460